MKGSNLVALHSIDSGVNEPGEFVIGVVDSEGTLHQVSGKGQDIAGFLLEFTSGFLDDGDGTYHLPPLDESSGG